MATLNVGKLSAEVSPDPSWKGLYRAGGISAMLFFVLNFVLLIMFDLITPRPPNTGEVGSLPSGADTLQYIASHKPVFIIEQVLFVGPTILIMVVFLALYAALKHLNKSYAAIGAIIGIASIVLGLITFSFVLGLLYLSDLYVTATATQRATFEAAAWSLIAQYNAVSASGILLAISILIISLVMLKGVFHKAIAYLGIVTGVVGIITEALRPMIGLGYAVYIILYIWLFVAGWQLYKLGRN
jgi:Domain of unknown function (DUF4386)